MNPGAKRMANLEAAKLLASLANDTAQCIRDIDYIVADEQIFTDTISLLKKSFEDLTDETKRLIAGH